MEDIVDTGKTLFNLIPQLEVLQPMSIAVCTLLQKPEALTVALKVDFVGFEIPEDDIYPRLQVHEHHKLGDSYHRKTKVKNFDVFH